MITLYIDTSSTLVLGVFEDDKNEWLSLDAFADLKGSSLIHYLIDEKIKENGLDFSHISSFIHVAGPGSYTGMRVSEGIRQIIAWHNIKTYSIWQFDIPELAGISSGTWLSKAFKGDFFLYHWSGKKTAQRLLVKEEELFQALKSNHSSLYSHNTIELGENQFQIKSTFDLLENHGPQILDKIKHEKIQRELYYYRDVQEEFKRKE